MAKKSTTENFIKKAREKFGNKFDYSKVDYINAITRVTIICPIHGEFEISPNDHLRSKNGCKKCGNDSNKIAQEDFNRRCIEIHKGKYDYSKTVYKKMREKITVTCPIHGDFTIRAFNHIQGQGCAKCGCISRTSKETKNIDTFIKEATLKHNGKYDYSKSVYINNHTPLEIICPKHGSFFQRPLNHLQGQGCSKCSDDATVLRQVKPFSYFIKEARGAHGNKYEYDEFSYKGIKDAVRIICPKHGEFYQRAYDHINGSSCPKCVVRHSSGEKEIFKHIFQFNPNIILGNRKILNGYEIDILDEDKKIGIEFNGIYWHSDNFNKKKDSYSKMIEALDNGIKLITIFEDEFVNHKEIVLSKIDRLLGLKTFPRIVGRKTAIREISYKESSEFLIKNHIQGDAYGSFYFGAFYENNLIGVMVFLKKGGNEWELNRFATDINYNCVGVGGKLFKYFIRNYNPKSVISFADRRWTINVDDNLYTKLGFKLVNILKPDYSYYCYKIYGLNRIHKFNFRKQKLHKKFGFPLTMTESEMAKELGAYKVWNCGLLKYKWENNKISLYQKTLK